MEINWLNSVYLRRANIIFFIWLNKRNCSAGLLANLSLSLFVSVSVFVCVCICLSLSHLCPVWVAIANLATLYNTPLLVNTQRWQRGNWICALWNDPRMAKATLGDPRKRKMEKEKKVLEPRGFRATPPPYPNHLCIITNEAGLLSSLVNLFW